MSREKQIEEMAVILTDGGCTECNCDANGKFNCLPMYEAELLYNAGYRKQKEGEWIEHSEIGAMNNAWECSVCHWKTVSFTEMKHSKFCPNCGAHMRGGKNE